jgi:hypothetical protein
MSTGKWKERAEPATYSDSPLMDALEQEMAALVEVEQGVQLVRLRLGRVARDIRRKYEPARNARKSA